MDTVKRAFVTGLNPEKEKAYVEQLEYIEKKYWDNICSLNKYYSGMETFICLQVLCANARAYKRGDAKEIWPGAGTVNMAELIADVDKLDSFAQ